MNIYILLDRSQSMRNHWDETIGSINGYVENLPGNTNVLLATFDNIGYDIIRDSKADMWSNISTEEVSPRGNTPLYDASARMMWRILDDKAEKAIFLVMTDGEENGSQFFNQAGVKKLVNQLDSRKYETIFLGANFDKVEHVAAAYSRGLSKTANMTSGNMGEFMQTAMVNSTMRYAASATGTLDFSDQERSVGLGQNPRLAVKVIPNAK